MPHALVRELESASGGLGASLSSSMERCFLQLTVLLQCNSPHPDGVATERVQFIRPRPRERPSAPSDLLDRFEARCLLLSYLSLLLSFDARYAASELV